jgi:hypothetical protein
VTSLSAFEAIYHHLPLDLSHSTRSISSHTFSQNPTNPTIVPVFGVGKAFVVVGFRI